MPYFNSSFIKIYYEVHGKGMPVVLLHGFSSSFVRNWLHLGWVDLLTAQGYQVIGLDLRGHGKSDKLLETKSYTPDVQQLMQIMSQAKLTILPGTDHLTVIRDQRCQKEVIRFFGEEL
jgi:pimeloyl-ACP methyl ester carboxylesterase